METEGVTALKHDKNAASMFAVAHVGVDLCLFVHGDNVLLRRVV